MLLLEHGYLSFWSRIRARVIYRVFCPPDKRRLDLRDARLAIMEYAHCGGHNDDLVRHLENVSLAVRHDSPSEWRETTFSNNAVVHIHNSSDMSNNCNASPRDRIRVVYRFENAVAVMPDNLENS